MIIRKTYLILFNDFVKIMLDVRSNISPKVFTNILRPFFPPISIGKTKYMAPGGAESILLLIDRMIWGSDCQNEDYHRYYFENLKYLPLVYREIDKMIKGKSLITILVEKSSTNDNEQELLLVFEQIMVSLIKFRRAHFKTAQENFSIRPIEALGSGGYNLNILTMLLDELAFIRKNTISQGIIY